MFSFVCKQHSSTAACVHASHLKWALTEMNISQYFKLFLSGRKSRSVFMLDFRVLSRLVLFESFVKGISRRLAAQGASRSRGRGSSFAGDAKATGDAKAGGAGDAGKGAAGAAARSSAIFSANQPKRAAQPVVKHTTLVGY